MRPIDPEDVLGAIRNAAAATGIEAYLVGGFVRDRLLGRPGKDIDLVTVGDGAGSGALLAEVARVLGWPAPVVMERFGTAQVRGGGWVLESVRARAERYDPASRRPEVRAGTLEEDIWRRDLTVNALVQTLEGRVLDITGRGLDDLAAGVLRTPLEPRETFSEDPLRMLRVARFASRLGFRPAPGLIEQMRAEAHRAGVVGEAPGVLSVERVGDELRGLVTGDRPRSGLLVLRDGGLLEHVLPEVGAMVGVEQSGYHRYDVFEHTAHALDAAPHDLVTRLAVLLHDVGKPPCHAVGPDGRHTFHDHATVGERLARQVVARLRFPGEVVDAVARLVRLHLRPIQYEPGWSDAAVRRLVRDAGGLRGRLLDVARADTRASAYPGTAQIDSLAERMAALDVGGAVSRHLPPLDGETLKRLAGRGPGPWIGRLQRALTEAVIDGRIPPGDPESALAWVEEHPELLSG